MKKNYITPNTEMTTWASMGIMQDPVIGLASGSGVDGLYHTNSASDID